MTILGSLAARSALIMLCYGGILLGALLIGAGYDANRRANPAGISGADEGPGARNWNDTDIGIARSNLSFIVWLVLIIPMLLRKLLMLIWTLGVLAGGVFWIIWAANHGGDYLDIAELQVEMRHRENIFQHGGTEIKRVAGRRKRFDEMRVRVLSQLNFDKRSTGGGQRERD